MTQHSPGPWDYNGPPHNMHVVQAAEPHMRVCFLTSDGPAVANARLIAAAPELFEYVESSASAGCATAKALIAKIKGADEASHASSD